MFLGKRSKLLGVILDNQLTCSSHIANLGQRSLVPWLSQMPLNVTLIPFVYHPSPIYLSSNERIPQFYISNSAYSINLDMVYQSNRSIFHTSVPFVLV